MSEKTDELLDAVDHACFQIVHMHKGKKLGIPIAGLGSAPLTEEKSGHPAFGWTLSDKAKRDIEAIDHNRFTALHRIGHIIVR